MTRLAGFRLVSILCVVLMVFSLGGGIYAKDSAEPVTQGSVGQDQPELTNPRQEDLSQGNPFADQDKLREQKIQKVKGKKQDLILPDKKEQAEKSVQYEKDKQAKTGQDYLVKFRNDCSLDEMYQALEGEGYRLIGYSKTRLVCLNTTDIDAFKEKASSVIESVEANQKRQSEKIANDTYYANQWAIPALNLPQAWDINTGNNTFFVAVIDSGIDRGHSDLDNADIRWGWDYLYGDNCWRDTSGHGTNVTGVIAAETNNYMGITGTCWNVAVIPFLVTDYDGSGYVADAVSAIYDAADLGCKVINMSFGGSSYSSSEILAIDYAYSMGCIMIASAGNSGSGAMNYPASCDHVISVGSINSDLIRSSFSNYNNTVDVCAPGESIITTAAYFDSYTGYVSVNGTSFSAPYVSGIAALVVSLMPGITPDQFAGLIAGTSRDLGSPGYDIYYGYGLINARSMLEACSNTYQVTFNSQGGSSVNAITALANQTIVEPSEPTRLGYVFDGWYKDAACTLPWNFASEKVTRSLTLYAKWTVQSYNVNFYDWDGRILKSQIVRYGGAATAPAAPSRTGYSFSGWDESFSYVTSDLWVYALYTRNTYTVRFVDWDGSLIKQEQVDYGESATAPVQIYRYGYTFVGWDKPFYMITSNLTVTALYKVTEYTVTFMEWDGSVLDVQLVLHGDAAISPIPAGLDGYVFAGWDVTFSEVYSDLYVTAQYLTVQEGQNLVLFNDWNGSTLKVEVVPDGLAATAPVNPMRAHYSFIGWDVAFDNVADHLTITAQYLIDTYTVTFDKNGGTTEANPKTIDAVYLTTITLPLPPTRTGYTFCGWNSKIDGSGELLTSSTAIIDDLTVYAQWLQIPVGVKATSTGYNSAKVTWTAIANASGYEVYRKLWSSGTYALVGSPTSNSLTDTGLSTNKSYYYKVRAYKMVGSVKVFSGDSVVVSVIPIPSVPANMKAISGGYDSAKVTWTAVAGANGYEVWRKLWSSGAYSLVGSPTTNSLSNSGLAMGKTYYYKVRAYRLVGTTKVYSTETGEVSVTPVLPAPTGLIASSSGYNSAKVTWTVVAGASGYEVWRKLWSTGTLSLVSTQTATIFNNSGLATNKAYCYMVRAYRLVGTTKVYSKDSVFVSVTPVPSAPTGLKVVSGGSKTAKVTWTAVVGASGYEVWRKLWSSGTYAMVANQTATSLTNSGLAVNKTYYYKVRAYRMVGTTKVYGPDSAAVTYTPVS